MQVLIIVESIYGNTRAVAEAIADGFRGGGVRDVEVRDVSDTDPDVPDELQLLLIGGPTHAFSMTREATRKDALGTQTGPKVERGIREWIANLQVRPSRTITFDTRVKVTMLPGSAAKSAVKALRDRGIIAEQGETFWVKGMEGPLQPGEIERAQEWGAELAADL